MTILVFAKNKRQFDSIISPESRLTEHNYVYIKNHICLEGRLIGYDGTAFCYLPEYWLNPVYQTEEFKNAYRRFIPVL